LLDIDFAQILIAFVVLVFSLTVHESAHAWTASRLGDPTGRRRGRVSLNPAVHVDVVGTLLFPLIAMVTHLPIIGWARPVPVDPRNLRNPRRDYLVIAAAGPMSNFVLAVASAMALRLLTLGSHAAGTLGAAAPLAVVASRALEINLLLAIFNMIPVPPLDGSAVLAGLLPERLAAGFDRLRPYGFLVLYGLMVTGALGSLVGPPFTWMLSWLL
jgi:Zn-dependent protease